MKAPTSRERAILRPLCLDTVEDSSLWPGAGKATEAALVAKGWIEPDLCTKFGTEGYRITESGKRALASAPTP